MPCRWSFLNTRHFRPWSRWATKDHTGFHPCQLRTRNCGYDGHRVSRTGQKKIGKMLTARLYRQNLPWAHRSILPCVKGTCCCWCMCRGRFIANYQLTTVKITKPTWVFLLILCTPLWPQSTHVLMACPSRITQYQRARLLKLVPLTWQYFQKTVVASTVTRCTSNRAPLGFDGMGDLSHECAADTFAATA